MSESSSDARFEADWLTLREPADHRARDTALTAAAAAWLNDGDDRARRIVDLGAGSGSNLRYLAPRLSGTQCWRLVDHDATLLERAATATPLDENNRALDIEYVTADLASADLSTLIGDADLVTATALFDLVDGRWIDALAAACRDAGAAVLFTLSVDGRIDFEPGDPDDARLKQLLAAHQDRDKGFGAALGVRAPNYLGRAFEAAGFEVNSADSDWQLHGHADAALAEALIAGWRDAAVEQSPAEADTLAAWAERRMQATREIRLRLTVGHRDLFAGPA